MTEQRPPEPDDWHEIERRRRGARTLAAILSVYVLAAVLLVMGWLR